MQGDNFEVFSRSPYSYSAALIEQLSLQLLQCFVEQHTIFAICFFNHLLHSGSGVLDTTRTTRTMEKTPFLIEDFMIGWISALPVERAAAISALDEKYSEPPQGVVKSDLYTLGRIGPHKIVIACQPDALSSTKSTAAVAHEVRRLFPCIRFWLMVGIGERVPQDTSNLYIGDVVISDVNTQDGGVIQYDLGETDFSGRYVQTGIPKAPPAVLIDALLKLRSNHPEDAGRDSVPLDPRYYYSLRRFDKLWNGPDRQRASDMRFESSLHFLLRKRHSQKPKREAEVQSQHGPRIHFGRIASVNQVVTDRATLERLSLEFGGMLCFDTESFGLINDFPCLVIRGICDSAESQKYSSDQPYTAAAAAASAKEYLGLIPSSKVAEAPVPSNVAIASKHYQGIPIGKLEQFKSPDQPNILILGETGVGKATFINAFINYLQFQSLDDSLRAKELHWTVPHCFTLQYVDISSPSGEFVSKQIRVGPSSDEPDDIRQHSGTQIINTGTFSATCHLINTPSISGASGIEQDRQNIASVMSTLTIFDKLHGILILLKPNRSGLSDTFRRYINELFTRLHKDAAKNIAFGFTHARTSNYEPGVTFKPLKEMLYQYEGAGITLDKDTVYCFDSESFKFLAAHKNGVAMGNAENFRASWQHSAKEVRRLLRHFQTREPHIFKLSMNLDKPRESVLQPYRCMVISSQQIRGYVSRYIEAKKELCKRKQKGDELRKQWHVRIKMRPHALENPRMVCTRYSCVTYWDDGDGKKVEHYHTPCHDPCYLEAPINKTRLAKVSTCEIFSGNRCTKCGHNWRSHMLVLHRPEATRVFELDETAIKANEREIATLKSRIDKIEAPIQKAFGNDRGKFGSNLASKDAITPFSDANFEYHNYLLQQDMEKAKSLPQLNDGSFLTENSPPKPKKMADTASAGAHHRDSDCGQQVQ